MSERGVTSVQFLLAGALALILFLMLANLVIVQYGRGALRSALDQGARVGSVTGSVTECQRRVDEVVAQLLGGRMGDSVIATCAIGPVLVTVSGEAVFESWTPFTPDYPVEMTAQAVLENSGG